MALYNNEALNGFPTGNFSLRLLNHIDPEEISFVCLQKNLLGRIVFGIDKNRSITLILRSIVFGKVILGV